MGDNPNFNVLFHNDRHSTIDESFDDVEEGIDKALEAYREVLTDPNLKSAEIVILANHQDNTVLLEDLVINKQDGKVRVEGGGWLIEPASREDSIELYDHLSRNFDFKVTEVWGGQTPEQMELEPRYIELANDESIELVIKGGN